MLEAAGAEVRPFELPSMPSGPKSALRAVEYLAATPRSTRSIGRAAASFGADLIVVNGPRAALPAVIAAKRHGVPAVIAIHLIHQGADRRLLAWCMAKPIVRRVTFCSAIAAEPFPELGPKAAIVPNWVAPSFLEATSPSSHNANRVVVGVLGRISKGKGQRLFLDAAIPLLDKLPNLMLSLGGAADFDDPGEEQALKQFAGAFGDRIQFLGKVDAIPYLDSLDISVVPSRAPEAFGLVAIESMARGRPVVAIRKGGLVDTVGPGVTGFLVDEDPDALRAAVEQLAEDADLRSRMGRAGRSLVESDYSPSKLIPRARDAILTLLESSPDGER